MTTADIQRANGSEITRKEFGAEQIEKRNETNTSALVAQARASIEARYLMAMQRPRDMDDVRQRLMKECCRSGFAERALYSLPRRQKTDDGEWTTIYIEGPSVRFAEAAIRLCGNIAQETDTLYDDDSKRVVRVTVTDLETNAIYSRGVLVDKTIERSEAKIHQKVLDTRTNTAGRTVYIIQATEDEIRQKESALISKTFRTLGLRLVAADVIDDCMAQVRATRQAKTAADPNAERKRMLDAFATINVMPSDLKLYLGHDVGTGSPVEIEHLRGLYASIKDREITWAEALVAKQGAPSVADPEAVKAETTSKASKIASKIRERKVNTSADASSDRASTPKQAETDSSPGEEPKTGAPTSGSGVSPAVPTEHARAIGGQPVDWGEQADLLKEMIADAKTDEQVRQARLQVRAFVEGPPFPPADIAAEVQAFFRATQTRHGSMGEPQ